MQPARFQVELEAWDYRVKTGQRGAEMDGMVRRLGPRALKMYADWTDKIAAGELPPAPERPSGVERNVVVTMWDWGNDTSYMHDEITTSKQQADGERARPRLRRRRRAWHAGSTSIRYENTTGEIDIETRDDPKSMRSRFPPQTLQPSNFWGEEVVHAGVVRSAQPDDGQQRPAVGDDDGQPDACPPGARTRR